jgi:ABC-2 type transport system permease protein
MNTMTTLLKREFWEHKGGMFWAPLIVGSIMALFATGSVIFGTQMAREHMVNQNGLRVASLAEAMPPEAAAHAGQAIAFSYLPTLAPFMIVLTFVVLFYSLGSLYDDRRDRSVLFWKSMPISDTATVLSKLASILLVAPLMSMLMGIVFGVGFIFLTLTAAATLGANLFGAALTSSSLYTTPLAILAVLPVYILWALPSVAWFMAVSAWAKRAPFLWAVGVPVLGGVIISWAEAMFDAGLPYEWYWENIVGRLFGSIVPGLFFALSHDNATVAATFERMDHEGPPMVPVSELLTAAYQTLAAPTVWIGLGVAVALILLTIRLRRWREDAA